MDGKEVQDLSGYLKAHWKEVRGTLESGKYRPSPVRRVEIPKPGGGVRQLGIPTVLDRLIQQAIAQVLMPMFEAVFSPHSYGFRPGRSAPDALRQILQHLKGGLTAEDYEDQTAAEPRIDRVIAIGCTYLMSASAEATRPHGIKTMVSLNPIMVDGTGMCGACRCTEGGKTRFACVDGPDFDGHAVDWAEVYARRKSYFDDEIRSLCAWEEKTFG